MSKKGGLNSLQIGKKERGDVFEAGDGLIFQVLIMTSPQIKCNGAAQSTWVQQLGTLAAQHHYGKPCGVRERFKLGTKFYPNTIK